MISVRLCLLMLVFFESPHSAPAQTALEPVPTAARDLQKALAEVHASGLSPEEQVARTEAILRKEAAKHATPPAQAFKAPRLQATPRTQAEENTAALLETRASARTPEEEIKLVDELFRLNPAQFIPPPRTGNREGLAAARAALQVQGGMAAECRDAILELHLAARTPEESVRLVGEFLDLNRDALQLPILSKPAPDLNRPPAYP